MPVALALGVVLGVRGLAIGALLGNSIRRRISQGRIAEAERDAATILAQAQTKEKEILLEAKEEAIRLRAQVETELKDRRGEVLRVEQRTAQREENLDRKLEALERRNETADQKEQELARTRTELEELRKKQLDEIERVSGLTSHEARDILLAEVEKEAREEANRRVRATEGETGEEADERARDIVATAMQRLATDVVSETTVSVVPIPSDDMKGRIIGREGRNIRALESATGVDLIIDDTPDAVTLSAFDPVRREVARQALTKLVTDGRIHPTRIEEVVEKDRQEIDAVIRAA